MSKGGDSSSSASAQNPSQWASAQSNATIAAWKEADILSFSVAQLQALTPEQISYIKVPWALPMAVWTADTLNAVPLQYWSQWGTRYLSTTSNGVTSITLLSQSSNGVASGKNNWFDDVAHNATSNGFAFTPSIVAGISNERIAQIGGGLGRNQAHAPSFATNAGYVSPSDFTAALSAATASGANVVTWHISASQTAYMFASGWADMGADFMGALTYSQLGAIAHPETALGTAQFGYLGANQLTALGQMDWSKVTSAQLNATKISAFRGLQNNVLRALSTQTWTGLDQAHTAVLTAADVQLLPATTIAQMPHFGYALTANVGAVLTAAQVANIPSACWAQISDSQFLNSLSTAAFQAIPVSAFASMSDAVVASLDSVHVAALTAHQAQNYPLNKLSDASSALYQNPNTLNFATFVSQSNVNWALAPASFIKRLTPAQLRLISPSQMAALTPTALSALTRAQTQSLSLAQIQALSARQLSAMVYISRRTDVVQEIFGASQLVQLSLSFWSNVDSNFLNALALNAFQAITTTQLQAIAAGAFANLDQAHVNALTGTQLLALTAEQVGQFNGAYLSIAFLRGVRLTAFKGLVPDQMHRLHDYLFNTVANNAFATTDPTLLQNAENQFASLLASILESDDGREAWLQQSVNLLIQLRWLDATAAANLSASDVTTTYLALNWNWMSGTFLNSINTIAFAQLRASSVAQLNLNALAMLDDRHLQALTVTQAAALSGAQLSSISNLGALSVAVVQSLSATQLAGIRQDWSQISANFLNNMTASQFMGLPPAQFGQLTAAQLSATAIDWRLISPEQLNALSLNEFENLCTGANPTILHTTVGVLLGLGGEQTAILARAASHYSAAQMNTLLNRLFGAFTTEQTSRLISLMKKDSADQIVLQTGLVALLANIDGSTDGIDAAIQTLVSLRKMQPDWFSAANLSAVLPALGQGYTSYLQTYRAALSTQNLYRYALFSQAIKKIFLTRYDKSQVAIATSTILTLGNLLVMIGASINALGQAIEANSNIHLSKKERDDLIANASLSAILNISRSVRLVVNEVLNILKKHYATVGAPMNTAVDLPDAGGVASHGSDPIRDHVILQPQSDRTSELTVNPALAERIVKVYEQQRAVTFAQLQNEREGAPKRLPAQDVAFQTGTDEHLVVSAQTDAPLMVADRVLGEGRSLTMSATTDDLPRLSRLQFFEPLGAERAAATVSVIETTPKSAPVKPLPTVDPTVSLTQREAELAQREAIERTTASTPKEVAEPANTKAITARLEAVFGTHAVSREEDVTLGFSRFLATLIVHRADIQGHDALGDAYAQATKDVLDAMQNNADIREQVTRFAARSGLTIEGGELNKVINLTPDSLALAIQQEAIQVSELNKKPLPAISPDALSEKIGNRINMQDFVGRLTTQIQQQQPSRLHAADLFGIHSIEVIVDFPTLEHASPVGTRPPLDAPLPARTAELAEEPSRNPQAEFRKAGISSARMQLITLRLSVVEYSMLAYALFCQVLGIAAALAGIIYAAQSTALSWQAKAMVLAMNGVRVLSSGVMLISSVAQTVATVAKVTKNMKVATDAMKISNETAAIGNLIGMTTNIAQIGIQAKTVDSATDSTTRLIAGLSILDSTLQLILDVVGTIALAFGPQGIVINLVTFIIASLLPNTAAIATAVEYHKSYEDLTSQGLYKEAEVMYMHWQVAAIDASPIINWTSLIYTVEMKKAQERKMDHAWLDKSAEERLLYSLRSSTTLKDNFDSLRAQMYAGAVALTQPLGNLSQTLTRATMLMLSQDNLSYFEGDKLATVKLAGTLNYSTNTVSRAPKLIGANVNGQTLSLVFNQDLASLFSQLPSLSSFSVLVNGTAVAVSGLAVLNNVITLSLATAVTAGQSVTFSYSDPTAGNDSKAVQNVLGVDAASIVNHSVVNGLDSDKRAPQLADAVAQDNFVTLVFDETLSTAVGKTPVRGAFSVLVNGSAVRIYNLGVHDQRVLLSLDDPIAVGATVTVSYNATYGDGALQDSAGNQVASLNAQRVDNTGATSTVTASRVGWLQYDNFVSSVQGTGTEAASVLNGSDYTVYATAGDATSGTSRLRYLSLSNAAGEFDMLSVTRAVENNDRIWLDASNAQGVNNFAINTHDMMVWGGQGKNSYSLARPYAAQSYIVAANAWSDKNNVISISGSASDTSKKVNLDYFLTADNISAGLPVTQNTFTVLGANDGLDVVVGSGDNQSYMATSNVANINLTGANANVSVGESAQVSVGVNGRVQVDMDMWRGLNATAPVLPSTSAVNGVIKGNYGSYSLLNFAPTDSLNANFNGKLNLSYQIGHLPRLDAFSVYVGSTLVGVNSLSVNGKTLTLNLSSAVAQNEVVSVSYADASSADDDNTLQGLTGKDVNSFSRQAVVNTTADTTAPKLAVATVQGNSLIVHFSEALQQSYRPLNSAWSVYVGGNRVAVNTVAFNDTSSLRLTLASAVAAGQTVSLNYSAASDTSVAVQDLAGNVTSSFSSASVINLANVTQAPNLRTVTANGNVLTLTFDGTVRYTLSNPSAFVVTANNTPLNISGVSVAGNSVLLSLTSAVSSGQLVEVSYNAPQQVSDATTLRDWLGNTVGSISAQVANNITGQDLTAPSLQYAVANGTSLVLTFSEVLNNQAGFTPLPSGFAINVNGKAVNVTQAVVSGATVTLSLASAANYGDTMTLSYTDLSTGNDAAVVQDLAGNDAVSFANINVINNTPDTTPPSLLSATVNGNQLSLLFSESLNASSGYLPALTSMAVTVNGVAVSINAGSVIGDTATLTLGTAVNAGDYVNFNYTAPSGNTLQAFQDGAGNDLLSIANFNVTNLTGLDLTPPSLVSAQVNGTILTLTFSEALASTASFTPGASAFTVSVDGNSATVSGVRLNGTQAVLTLASAVDSTAKVIVGYVRPSTQAIQDGAQNMAASFSAQSVSNVTADTTPPSLSSASVAGAVLTLTFSENLATTPALLASASEFAVTVDGQVVDVLSAVSSGNSVSITLSKAVTASQKVSVDYTVSTSGTNYLQDVANNKTANFSRTVQNSSGLASIQNATVNGTTLSLIFNQELDANSTHLPPLSAFAVKVNGVSSAVSNLAVNGHVVTLTLGAAVTAGQKVTVNYTSTDNDLTALQNRGGLDVQSFSAPYAVHNLSVAPEAATPSLSNAKMNGSTLTLTFSEALDAGVGEWWVNYLPDGLYDASGNPVVTSRIKASGFVNVLGSNSNDSFIIGDQSGLDVSRQLDYVQLGNGQGVQVNYYDTSGNLFLALGNKGQANVILESGSSLQKLLTAKLVQGDADIANYKANRDTVTLKSLSSLTAFLSGYETIDATDSTSRLMAEIGEGDHQIKLGGQTVHLEFDKAVSNTSISTRQIPNSWLDYQYFNFKDMNADGLWVGRESDGTVLFRAQWKDSASGGTDNKLNVSYDGTLSNVVFEVGNVVSGSKTSQLRLDKLIEAMSNPAFSTDPNAASHAMTDADTSTKLYRITDIVAYSAASQPTVTGGV